MLSLCNKLAFGGYSARLAVAESRAAECELCGTPPIRDVRDADDTPAWRKCRCLHLRLLVACLKSRVPQGTCGFDPHPRHQSNQCSYLAIRATAHQCRSYERANCVDVALTTSPISYRLAHESSSRRAQVLWRLSMRRCGPTSVRVYPDRTNGGRPSRLRPSCLKLAVFGQLIPTVI